MIRNGWSFKHQQFSKISREKNNKNKNYTGKLACPHFNNITYPILVHYYHYMRTPFMQFNYKMSNHLNRTHNQGLQNSVITPRRNCILPLKAIIPRVNLIKPSADNAIKFPDTRRSRIEPPISTRPIIYKTKVQNG